MMRSCSLDCFDINARPGDAVVMRLTNQRMTKHHLGEDDKLNEIAHTIRAGIRRFKEFNERGDYSTVMTWVIPAKLACAARPLRYHHIYGGSGKTLPPEAKPELDKWIEC